MLIPTMLVCVLVAAFTVTTFIRREHKPISVRRSPEAEVSLFCQASLSEPGRRALVRCTLDMGHDPNHLDEVLDIGFDNAGRVA